MSLYVSIKKKLGKFALDIEFESQKGVAGLLGASGCGKSMTLKAISGIITPDEGRIVLNGRTLFDSAHHINLPPQERRVGHLFQNYALFPNMTVEQNIGCGLHHEKDKVKRKKALAEMIQKMRLAGLDKQRPSQLSGGQQQRTALARILVGNPEILLLDEPFSALDGYLREQLSSELYHLLEAFDKDALLVTHSRDEAYKLCGTLALIDNGRIAGMGAAKEIFSDPRTRFGAMITGCKNIVAAKKAGHCLVEVPAWGVIFETAKPVGGDLCAIGVRAHYFSKEAAENAYPIHVVETIEEPFEWTIKFRYEGQSAVCEPVWWRITKCGKLAELPGKLGIMPQDIMLLYS